jgi:hypothetical protein
MWFSDSIKLLVIGIKQLINSPFVFSFVVLCHVIHFFSVDFLFLPLNYNNFTIFFSELAKGHEVCWCSFVGVNVCFDGCCLCVCLWCVSGSGV